MDIEILKEKIENLLFEYWAKMPKEKPTYTSWFYSKGGPQEKTGDLLLEIQNKTPSVSGPDQHGET